jgi:plasmid segregation protein ParM
MQSRESSWQAAGREIEEFVDCAERQKGVGMEDRGVIARAIDVGFGNVKFTKGYDQDGKEIVTEMFPSLAPSAASLGLEGFMGQRNTVIVEAGSSSFEVGPDALLAMKTNASRSMDIDFPLSDQYLALTRGALHYMGKAKIDVLVVGLPVSSIGSLGERVRSRMVGEHPVAGRTVTVGECVVVPQPVGGMWDYAVRHRAIPQFKESTCLLVDPGWFTMDWLVTKDMKIVPGRTDAANNAGMGAVVRAISESMGKKISERDGRPCEMTEQIVQRIDKALYSGGFARINGKEEQVEIHAEAGKKIMRDGMQKMMASIGSRSDIDCVIVVGGAAALYAPSVCEVFGADMVRVSQNPVFANVRGFQIMASQRAKLHAAA